MAEKLNGTLQENVITLLAHDEKSGKVVANLIDPSLFEGEYRTIAERCTEYWKRYGIPPKEHTADLFDDIIGDKGNRKAATYKRILTSMYQLAPSINAGYVLDRLQTFARMQRIKTGVLKSAEKLSSQQELAIEEVEEIWNELLRDRAGDFDRGVKLTEVDRFLDFFKEHYTEFTTGIPILDQNRFVPFRGGTMVMIGATGKGKSWWLIQLGKQAMLRRKKVLHITLEMPAEEVMLRYYQSLFSATKREAKAVAITRLEVEKGKVDGFTPDEIIPDFSLESNNVELELASRMRSIGARLENLVIKRFPTRQLTVPKLRAFLDNLEAVDRFIPDIVLLDYLGIMHTDARDHRVSLGRTFEDLRGLSVERNFHLSTAHQSSKLGADARTVEATHVAEDWSIIGTSDQVITYSQTKAEAEFGLARLYVSKARSDNDKFSVLITQSYPVGQFVLESTRLQSRYFDLLDRVTEEEEQIEEAEED